MDSLGARRQLSGLSYLTLSSLSLLFSSYHIFLIFFSAQVTAGTGQVFVFVRRFGGTGAGLTILLAPQSYLASVGHLTTTVGPPSARRRPQRRQGGPSSGGVDLLSTLCRYCCGCVRTL